MVLYRKFRPSTFASIKEQNIITDILRATIIQQSVAHAYLFTGTRGTGKTTTARLFAKAINCEQSNKGEPCTTCAACISFQTNTNVDLIEIDAASNRGIDDIREIKEKINFAPTMSKFKVYIIDEVHMLTKDAFNALLKTLEEPPAHVVFILATTEVYKVPLTVLSRCQRFDFKNASLQELRNLILEICLLEDIKIDKESIQLLAELGEGSFRDALSLLEKLRSVAGQITYEKALTILGVPDRKVIISIIVSVKNANIEETINIFKKAYNDGMDVYQFNKNFLKYLETSLLEIIGKKSEPGDILSMGDTMKFIRELLKAEESLKFSMVPSLVLEATLIELCYIFSAMMTKSSSIPIQIPSVDRTPTENKIPKAYLQPTIQVKVSEPIQDLSLPQMSQNTVVVNIDKNMFDEKNEISKSKIVSHGEIMDLWSEVILKIIPYNHHLGSFFSQARPIEIMEGYLVVEVKYTFHKERIEEVKSKEAIAKVLSEVYQRPLYPKCIVNNKLEVGQRALHLNEQEEIIDKKQEIGDNMKKYSSVSSQVSQTSELDLLDEALRIFELE